MKNVHSLIHLIDELIRAENEEDNSIAEPILSQNFIAIIRASGEEQNREDLLKRIDDPPNKNIIRHFKGGHDMIASSKNFAVIESIVITTDKENPIVMPKLFRNMHIFVKEDVWRCISWEVTEIKDETLVSSLVIL
jgi:hypothetical protein